MSEMAKDVLGRDVKMRGPMQKKGGMRWQRRFFVLRQSGTAPGTLVYYKDENNTRKGEARAALELTSDAKVERLSGRPFGFQVIMKGRALKVAPETEKEMVDWISALRECIALAVSQNVQRFSGIDWVVDPKYKLMRKVGSGAYGFVVAADDLSNPGKQVAIKKVEKAFEDMVDAKRILREVRLMRHFDHPNVVKLYDIMEPPFTEDFEDLYIVTELMSTDLQKILYSKTTLSKEQLQYLLYQLLSGMNYVNSAGVLHRDLKPSNLLIDIQTCNLQICDFGLARGTAGDKDVLKDDDDDSGPGVGDAATVEGSGSSDDDDGEGNNVKNPPQSGGSEDDAQEYTEYVVTRWYRAPEIMLGYHMYDSAIDMWSIGCIFGEMMLQQPVFPGSDYIHQLKLIVKLIGRPSQEDLWFVDNKNALNFMLQLPDYKAVDLPSKFPSGDAESLDLLASMIVFNPAKRTSLHNALAHRFVAEFREPDYERDAGFKVKIDDVEQIKLTKPNLQRMLHDEIRAFHRHAPLDNYLPNSSSSALLEDQHQPQVATAATANLVH